MKTRIWWFILFFYSTLGYTQNPELAYRKYTAADGLPSSEVYHCLQDSEDYIWFATDRGVARYNGYDFTIFNTENGLTDNVVFELFEDYKGRIWVLPMNRKLCYFENDSIVEYPYNELLSEDLAIKYGHSFYVDTLDNVYFGSKSNGMKIISKEGEQRVLKGNDPSESGVYFLKVKEQLLSYSVRSSTYVSQPKTTAASFSGIRHVYEGQELFNTHESKRARAFKVNRNLVINSFSTLFLLDEYNQVVDTISHDNQIVYFNKSKELLVVGVFGSGLYVYKVIDNKLVLQHHLLNQYTCSSFLQDREGGYWITTTQQGVFYAPSLDVVSYNQSNGLLHDYIYKLDRDKEELLIGYPDTIQKLNRELLPFIREPVLASNNITLHDSLFFERSGCFISYGGQIIFNVCTGKRLFTSEEEKSSFGVSYRDAVYFLNIRAVFKYIPDTIIPLDLHHDFTLIEDLEIIGEDSIWIASSSGLYWYTPDRIQALSERDSVFAYRIIALDRTERFGLLAATRGGGLAMLKEDSLQIINTTNGLSTDEITSMYVDAEQNIWLATNQGLHMVDAHDPGKVNYYSTNEGLISNEITDVRRIGEKVYVGTKKGLSIIDLKTFKKVPTSIRIELLSIQLDGHETLDKETPVTLTAGKHILDIHYLGINYRAAGNIEYNYRIKGQEDGLWKQTTSQRLKLEVPAKPGTYVVEIMARALPNGRWNEANQIISLQVALPFYKTSSFLLSSGFVGLLLFYLGYKTNVLHYRKHVLHEIFKRILKKLGKKSFITIKVDKSEIRIDEAKILYVKSYKDYVEINTTHEKYLYRSTLKDMEKKLGPINFIRIHRSYIVAIDKIDSISKHQLQLKELEIPIGKTYRAILKPLQEQFSAINN